MLALEMAAFWLSKAWPAVAGSGSMPATFADSPRNGAWGDRPYAILDFSGPASYIQMVTSAGVPPTGGQPINAGNFGLVAPLEGIFPVGISSSGIYTVQPVQLTSYNAGSNNPTWALRWIVAASGAEVGAGVNLSGETVRLVGFGPY